jgi:Holliday junction resolvase-like predicted endonuclease
VEETQGQLAEKFAADYLTKLGFKIIKRNWRNKFCEIDIVAQRGDRIHFVEVKYRASAYAGRGVDYITPQKLRQMEFAARAWVSEHQFEADYQLDAVTIDGEIRLTNLDYIPNLTG